MSTLIFDAARSLPPAAALPLPRRVAWQAERVKFIAKRVAILTAISLLLCSVPDDGGPFSAHSTAPRASSDAVKALSR